MTEFYSNSLKEHLKINREKVCSWRTNTDWNKKGYVQGVKTGADNRAGHKLSRFATDNDVKEAGNNCAGNTNWLNYDGPVFNKARVNDPHALNRSAILSGTRSTHSVPIPDLVNKRVGLGNRDITRENFTAPSVLPRDPVDFDKIRALDISRHGRKIQLSDKTLDELLMVSVPDERDLKWIAEKERLELLGSAALPFGRPQRTVKKRINIGATKLGLETAMSVIKKAVDQGMTESKVERVALGTQIMDVLSDVKDVKALNERDTTVLVDALARLKLPSDWEEAGVAGRFWSERQIKEEPGNLLMFIYSNVRGRNTPELPIWNVSSTGKDEVININSLFRMNADKMKPRVFDAFSKFIMPLDKAIELMEDAPSTIDNGLIDNSPVAEIQERIKRGVAPFERKRKGRRGPPVVEEEKKE